MDRPTSIACGGDLLHQIHAPIDGHRYPSIKGLTDRSGAQTPSLCPPDSHLRHLCVTEEIRAHHPRITIQNTHSTCGLDTLHISIVCCTLVHQMHTFISTHSLAVHWLDSALDHEDTHTGTRAPTTAGAHGEITAVLETRLAQQDAQTHRHKATNTALATANCC